MTATPAVRPAAPVVVPIRSLGPGHRARIGAHLKALDEDDRYLRFGYPARDAQIDHYVDHIDFDRDDVFGIYNRKLELIAMAHLAYSDDPAHADCAEFGVSVLKKARGKAFGSRLFERAVIHARNEGVEMLFIHALSENHAMLHIASKAGARLERSGSETEAYLRLPPATFDTRMAELLEEQVAQTDYQFKQQAKRFWAFLTGLQQVREDVRDARHKTGS
jgi:RimJ/RimL family protein N-acetyltransferase